MALKPTLPVIEGESLTSYFNRAAAFHARLGLLEFLGAIELPQSAVVSPKEADISRIEGLTGLPAAMLKRMAFVPLGGRMRSIAGEVVHTEFANLEATRFCPACLLEDEEPGGASAGVRVGRIAWQIEHVRTCERHGIALHVRRHTTHAERLQLMSVVAPESMALEALAENAARLAPAQLQRYVLDRLDGKAGPPWLDGQPIDLAARACEMLGVIFTVGTHANLNEVTLPQWNAAADVGFEFAARGEAGIREALDAAYNQAVRAGLRGGPQKIYGRLYQWLQFSKNGKPFGPIRDIVQEFVLDNFPIEAGTVLFGATVDRQRIHSAHSLAKLTGEHLKTITRAVVHAGLAEGDPEKPNARMIFDAEEGMALIRRIQDSIPVLQLPDYLNCNRTQAEQLVRAAVIPRLAAGATKVSGVLNNVAREDADVFIARLLAASSHVDVASEGMLDIVRAAEVSRWPVLDIVTGILAGKFARLECIDPGLKFKGLLVDPVEVRAVLLCQAADGFIAVDEAARRIAMKPHHVTALAKMADRDGTPYLPARFAQNSKGVETRVFSEAGIERFMSAHVTLKDFAAEQGLSAKVMRCILAACGIQPITEARSLGRIFYRRADLVAYERVGA